MPGCILRAFGSETGDDFDVDSFLSISPFTPERTFHRGQPRYPNASNVCQISGFNLTVSHADGSHVPVQIDEANRFIVVHREEISRLVTFPNVHAVYLDFGWELPLDGVQFNRFPLHLLRECVALGVELEVSVYTVGSESKVL